MSGRSVSRSPTSRFRLLPTLAFLLKPANSPIIMILLPSSLRTSTARTPTRTPQHRTPRVESLVHLRHGNEAVEAAGHGSWSSLCFSAWHSLVDTSATLCIGQSSVIDSRGSRVCGTARGVIDTRVESHKWTAARSLETRMIGRHCTALDVGSHDREDWPEVAMHIFAHCSSFFLANYCHTTLLDILYDDVHMQS